MEIRRGRIDEAIAPEERFVGILADPPWVPSAQTSEFSDDPLTAIDGGEDGLALARVCLQVIDRHLAAPRSNDPPTGHRPAQADHLMDALESDRPRRTEPGTGRDPRVSGTEACCCTSPAAHESSVLGCVIVVVVIEPGEEDREALIRARFLSGGTGHVALIVDPFLAASTNPSASQHQGSDDPPRPRGFEVASRPSKAAKCPTQG